MSAIRPGSIGSPSAHIDSVPRTFREIVVNWWIIAGILAVLFPASVVLGAYVRGESILGPTAGMLAAPAVLGLLLAFTHYLWGVRDRPAGHRGRHVADPHLRGAGGDLPGQC